MLNWIKSNQNELDVNQIQFNLLQLNNKELD